MFSHDKRYVMVYNGEIYNQELTEVAELITSPEAIKNNLAHIVYDCQ